MTKVCIRHATIDDIDLILPLFEAYRAFYGEEPRDKDARQFLRERYFLGESKVILAEIEDRIVGFTQLFPSFSSVSLERLWILNDLFVDVEVRGLGVGQQLLTGAAKFGREANAKQLFIEGAVANVRARRLYEDFGFVLNSDYAYYHYPL